MHNPDFQWFQIFLEGRAGQVKFEVVAVLVLQRHMHLDGYIQRAVDGILQQNEQFNGLIEYSAIRENANCTLQLIANNRAFAGYSSQNVRAVRLHHQG
jgi:hypothetical protein